MRIPVNFSAPLAVMASFVALFFVFGETHTLHGAMVSPPQLAPDFTLLEAATGQPFHFRQNRGEITLLYFGYTHSPDKGAATLEEWERIKRLLGADAERVRFIFITVDPVRDTASVLAEYLKGFDESIVGLTGSPDAVAGVVKAYGIWVERGATEETGLGYAVHHTASTLLIDRQGRMRVMYPLQTPASAIIADIRFLLAGG